MGSSRELVFELRAENADLRAKLAAASADIEKFKAANAGVAPGAQAATAALTAEEAAAKGAGVAADAHVAAFRAQEAAAGGAAAAVTKKAAAEGAATGTTKLYSAATAQGSAALVGKTANLGALTSGFLRFLGPIGLATAAIALLPSIVRGLRDAFKQLSDIIDGSVSKALADMRDGFEKAQEKLEGLDAASRNYRDAADLLAASGLNAKGVIDGLSDSFKGGADSAANFGGAVVFAGDGFVSLGGGAATAKSAIDGLSNIINEVRLTAPEAAREASAAFVALSKSFADGEITAGEFFEKVRGMRDALLPLAQVAKEVGDAIGKKFPDDVKEAKAALGALEATVPALIAQLDALKAGGLSNEQAFDVLKSQILATVQGSEKFKTIIDSLLPQLAAQLGLLKDTAKGHDTVSEAIKKVREEAEKAAAKHQEAIVGMAGDLRKLSAAYQEDTAEIEKHRAKSIKALQEEATAARQSAEDQIKALNERNRNQQLSAEEYAAERRKIDDEELAARRANEKELAQINADVAKDLKKVSQAFRDKSQVVHEELAKEGTSLRDAGAAYDANTVKVDALIRKVNELGEAPGKAATAFVAGADTIEAALDRIRAMGVKVDAALTSAFRTAEGAGGGPPSPTNPVGGGEGVQ